MLLVILIPLQIFAATTKKAVDVKRWNSLKSIEYRNSINQKDVDLFVPADDLVNLANPEEVEPVKDLSFDSADHANRNEKVGKKIMDHTFKSFAKGKLTPNAKIFQTVENLEQSMKYDITIPKSSADDIEHKFNLQYQPFQNMAKIKYRGFLQANIEYFLSDATLECSIEKELSQDMRLAVTHGNDGLSPNNSDTMSMFLMKWELK